MQIEINGKRNITLDFNAPKKFRLVKDGAEIPYIRTGKNSFRLSKPVDGFVELEEVIEKPRIVKPIQLQPQHMALVNPNDVIMINQAAQQLEIEQGLLSETQKQINYTQEYLDIQQQNINDAVSDVKSLETDNAQRISNAESGIFNLAGEIATIENNINDEIVLTRAEIENHENADNPHRITKKTIGLDKLDNTSDLDKPISKAVQSALDEKADKTEIEAIREEIGEYQEKNERINNALSNYTGGLASMSDHRELQNRDFPDQHPIGAITGLQTALDGKVDKTSESSKVYGTDESGQQTTYNLSQFGGVSDVRVDGESVVTDNVANLGSMAGETASDYSTTAQADLRYATASQGALADTALQPNDNITELTNNAGFITIASVPTAVSQLTNDSNYQTGTQVANAISAETSNRENADNNLQNQIDAIVSSSDVFDIVGTYAELQAYNISTVPVNDIIKVLVDSTHSGAATYYRCVESGGVKSWSYIGSEGAYYTKGEADSIFVPQTRTVNNKALSNNITLTASDVGALPDSTVIPTVNNATLTIQKNGTTVKTFTANASTDVTANITVPTKVSDLTNDSGFISGITSSDVTTALGYTPYNSSNPSGYQANVIETVKVNGTALTPSSKAVDITVPAAQVNSDWNASSGVAQILNKPTIPTVNNATLTITQGGTTKGTFTANAGTDVTIALDAGGGSVDVDNKSITTNASSQIQTVGVINSRDTSTAIKTWTGTRAQYNAITTKDANTLYNITDDTDVSLPILEALYPVGSVYITTANTCPLSTLISGSTWTLRDTGIVTSVNTNVPCRGTGQTLGLTNGNVYGGLQTWSDVWLMVAAGTYNTNYGTSSTSGSQIKGGYQGLGVTTDSNCSGIVGTVTRSTLTVNIFERTA